ncbi:MAG: spore germination protein, partial [Bacillota bacterium]|nr:spore germination protein [Bacillota bacterium]
MRRTLALGLTFVLLSTLCAGCWDRREINELALVSSVGVDKEKDLWRLTAEIFRPPAGGGEGGGGGGGPIRQVWVARGQGYTVFQAIRDMAAKVPRRVYWAHCTVVIVGEETARAGITEVLDFWDRDPEARRSANILVCRGRAEDLIVDSQGSLEKTVGLEVVGLKKVVRANAHSRVSSINEFLVAMAAAGADPITGGVELKAVPEPPGLARGGGEGGQGGAGSAGSGGSEGGGGRPVRILRLKGMALFRKDKLVGFLEPAEARGLNWVRGDFASTIINVRCPQH